MKLRSLLSLDLGCTRIVPPKHARVGRGAFLIATRYLNHDKAWPWIVLYVYNSILYFIMEQTGSQCMALRVFVMRLRKFGPVIRRAALF